jgi:hypothetical protein
MNPARARIKALLLAVATCELLVLLMGLLGGVGAVELLLALVLSIVDFAVLRRSSDQCARRGVEGSSLIVG